MWSDIRNKTRRHEGQVVISFLVEGGVGARMWGERSNRREDFRNYEHEVVIFSVAPSVGILALCKSLQSLKIFLFLFVARRDKYTQSFINNCEKLLHVM